MFPLVSNEAIKRGVCVGGGGLLPRVLPLSPQNSLDGQRWYFIILVHSVYSNSIITFTSYLAVPPPLSLSISLSLLF